MSNEKQKPVAFCEKCGKPTEFEMNFPLFPGTEKMIVHVMCDCEKAEQEEENRRYERDAMISRIERLRAASAISGKYETARFRTYKNTPENKEARRYAGNYVENFDKMHRQGQGLIFIGPVGTGKTYTAACIANELLDRATPVFATSFVRILREIQGNSEAESEIMRAIETVDLVILDDLGAERNTDYALEKVYGIVDARVRSGMPMILTTNLTYKAMKNESDMRYQRIYDRILEVCIPVLISGRSYRQTEAVERYASAGEILSRDTA